MCVHNHIHTSSKLHSLSFSLAWFLLHSQESPLKNFFVFFSLTFILAALHSIAEHGLSLVVAQGLLSLQ